MNLLALDTSTETCSVALRVGDTVTVRRHAGAREQTAHVLPIVQALLAEAGIALRDLDAIACAHGPGAFTGVRVAVSVTQGLAYGAQVPAIGISTLAALAQQAAKGRGEKGCGEEKEKGVGVICPSENHSDPFFGDPFFVLPVLDARMGELYAGAYRVGSDGLVDALAPDRLVRPEDFAAGVPPFPPDAPPGARWAAIGSGWSLLAGLTDALPMAAEPAMVAEPDALDVLALAARALARGDTVPADRLLPVYLRDTVAWKKLAEQGKP